MRKIFMVLMMAVAVVTMASFAPVAPAVELTEPADIPVPVVEAVPLVSKEVVSTPPPVVETSPPEEVFPLTQEEIELIALVTMAEAEGECEYGQRLVIDTILNRVDDPHFPDTVHEVVYQKNQFSSMWNGRVDRCYVKEELVDLVKGELRNRTNYDVAFFRTERYSDYGVPMFQVEHHYFSSYDKRWRFLCYMGGRTGIMVD